MIPWATRWTLTRTEGGQRGRRKREQPRRSERGCAWGDAEGWPQAGAWVSDCLGVRGLGVERGHYWHCPGGQLRVALLFVSHPTTRTDARVLKTRTLSWILGRVRVRLYFRAGGSATPRWKAIDVTNK